MIATACVAVDSIFTRETFYDTITNRSKTRLVPGLLKSDVHRKSGGSFETGCTVMEKVPVQRVSFFTTNNSTPRTVGVAEGMSLPLFRWYIVWICASSQAAHDTISCTE
jgi:hypothetical protein